MDLVGEKEDGTDCDGGGSVVCAAGSHQLGEPEVFLLQSPPFQCGRNNLCLVEESLPLWSDFSDSVRSRSARPIEARLLKANRRITFLISVSVMNFTALTTMTKWEVTTIRCYKK